MGWGVGDCGTLEEDGDLAGVGFVVGPEEAEEGLLTINTLLTVGKHNTVSGITTPGHSRPSIRQQVVSTHYTFVIS